MNAQDLTLREVYDRLFRHCDSVFAEHSGVFDRLSGATALLSEIASALDRCDETDEACEEAKRIEMELCILESRLRHIRKQSEVTPRQYA